MGKPKIKRLNKIKDPTTGRLISVTYFYELLWPQENLLRAVIDNWGYTPPITNDIDGVGILPIIRRVLRTHEYNDLDKETLLLVREWYIKNMIKQKSK